MTIDGIGRYDAAQPDGVLREARRLVHGGRRPGRGVDPALRQAWRHLSDRSRGKKRNTRTPQKSPTAIESAFAIADDAPSRLLVRGLILARQTPTEIERCCGTPAEAIQMYETVFWNVRSRLDRAGAVFVLLRAFAEDPDERFYLSVAYTDGAQLFLQASGVKKVQPQTSNRLRRLLADRSRKAALQATYLPIESEEAARRAMRSYVKLQQSENRSVRMQSRYARERERLQHEKEALAIRKRRVEAMRRTVNEKVRQVARQQKELAREKRKWAGQLEAAAERAREDPPIVTPNLGALQVRDPFADRFGYVA